ncbi:1278_t:CDS:10 [Ambispora gerdemannii]|uniref:1278_t:CDS:1 n=1 Tax=Ambispora gerdemannii TaxID=144530 RepID=A0A9N8WSE6_9GLOM|nr:1278_t:CDS:10 [Ambispora gerdemannii]
MPARTVVFSGIRKHDGKSFRDLLPGEYTQMSGRAGRRGLDPTGMVIIACSGDQVPNSLTLDKMICGTPTKLESQFRLTYNMILNLMRVAALRVEEMIKRSFSEHSSQEMLPEYQKMFDEHEKSLNAFKKLDCTICNPDINQYYNVSTRICDLNRELMQKIASMPTGISPGRVVIINNSFYRNVAAVVLKAQSSIFSAKFTAANTTINDKRFMVLILLDSRSTSAIEDGAPPPLPVTRVANPDQSSLTCKITDIASSDIAVVTKTTIKIVSENILENQDKLEIAKALQQLTQYATESQHVGILENDWSKIKELAFQLSLKQKKELVNSLDKYQCTNCPDLNEHYGMVHRERILRVNVEELRRTISDQNLELLPDYVQRIAVLRELDYISQNDTVQLKGRVACEINSADELILTELILENKLSEFEPAEIVALLSCFVFQEKQEKHEIASKLTPPSLEEGREIIFDIAKRVAEVQHKHGLPISPDDYLRSFNFGLVEVVYEWACEKSFLEVKELTDVLEGSIVRCITRLDETCREVRNAARIIGNHSLYKKMEDAQMLIKRDIVFAASLYF